MRLLVCFLFGLTLAPSQTITPFTLTEVSRRFDTEGKVISQSRFLFAALENGSIVAVDLDPSASGLRQIIDTARKQIILVNPSSRSASEMPYSWSPATSPCEQRFYSIVGASVSLDTFPRSMEGVPVQRISLGLGRGLSTEILVAPSLGCRVLQSTTLQNGRVVATRVSENVKIGNPDPSLFEVPPGYRLTRTSLP